MKKQLFNVLATLALAAPMASAHADLIDIVFTGIADFEVEEQVFEDAAFTVRTTADTAKLALTTIPLTDIVGFQYEDLPGRIEIAGLGEGTFTEGISVFSNPTGQIAGLMAYVNFMPFHQVFPLADMFGLKSPVLANYDLKSDLLLEGAEFYDPQQWYQVKTSFGPLTATGFESVTMQVSASAVPEISSALLFALGACFLGGASALRRSKQT